MQSYLQRLTSEGDTLFLLDEIFSAFERISTMARSRHQPQYAANALLQMKFLASKYSTASMVVGTRYEIAMANYLWDEGRERDSVHLLKEALRDFNGNATKHVRAKQVLESMIIALLVSYPFQLIAAELF